jgi:hypothetical protein
MKGHAGTCDDASEQRRRRAQRKAAGAIVDSVKTEESQHDDVHPCIE